MRARAKGGAAEREAESGNTSDSGGSKDRLGGFLSTLFKKGRRDDGGATSPRLDAAGNSDGSSSSSYSGTAASQSGGEESSDAHGSATGSGDGGESGEEHDGPLIVVPTRKLVIGGDVPGEEDKTRREYIEEEIVLTEQSYTEGLRTVVECYERLTHATDPDLATNKVLGVLLSYYDADRVSIYKFFWDVKTIYQRAETRRDCPCLGYDPECAADYKYESNNLTRLYQTVKYRRKQFR